MLVEPAIVTLLFLAIEHGTMRGALTISTLAAGTRTEPLDSI
jgi:hypothetical protein